MKALDGTIISTSPTNSTYSQPNEEGTNFHSNSNEGRKKCIPQQQSQGTDTNNTHLPLQKLNTALEPSTQGIQESSASFHFSNHTSKGKEIVAVMNTIQESNSSTQPPLEAQAVPMGGDMAMQIEKEKAYPALTTKPAQGKTWKRIASKVGRLVRESEAAQVYHSHKHNKRTEKESSNAAIIVHDANKEYGKKSQVGRKLRFKTMAGSIGWDSFLHKELLMDIT
ncbi:transcription factor ETV6 [Striga asiatica]|uniref:Transcription factor ETV6 n=1 Tax=Striga asiatica TaxID=4170 RepID=A0A5A7QC97_STRAF|nr:transcription factor ETV6 [Striga asiatica]